MKNKLIIGLLLSIGLVISVYAAQRVVVCEMLYSET